MFKWIVKPPVMAKNAIYLEDNQGKEGRPFKARFLQAGLVKYDFGVCLLQKETIDKFINTFVGVPVIIDHKDDIESKDWAGEIQKIWFSPEDGWFWCSGIITDEKAIALIENGYNISCQYAITEYADNTEGKLHNGNPYDKEILNGVFEHLAIVKNPRYEGAFIAANAYIAVNNGEEVEWITVKGAHIPIKKGKSKEEAIKDFLGKKNKNYEERAEEKNKQISKDYALMRSKDFVKSIHPNSQKQILFSNVDDTWLLVESWKKGEEGWDLVKAGKVVQHFDDRYEAYEAHEKGYFEDIEAMDKEKPFYVKKADIRPIKIKKSEIPHFGTKKELSNWVKEQFRQLGSVKINDTGIDLKLSSGNANRETIKRRASKEENRGVFVKFKDIVSKSIKKDERKADERHIKDQEIYYNRFQIDGEDYEVDIFVDKPIEGDKSAYYAGHNATKIKITPRETMGAQNGLSHHAKGVNYIMPHLEIDFNPNATINKEVNSYEEILKCINESDEGGQMDETLKKLCASLVDVFLKAKNEADEEKGKEEKKKEEEEKEAKDTASNESEGDKEKEKEKASNEDTDKRKLIDEIGGILKGKVDEELWRTIIGKAEKIAYSKSEAGTADNKAKNKCKNEDEDKEKEYEDLKEKIYEEVKNEIAKNSMDTLKSAFYKGKPSKPDPLYISPKKGLELGKQIYG